MLRITGPSLLVFNRMWISYFETAGSRPTSIARMYLLFEHMISFPRKGPGKPHSTTKAIPHSIAKCKLLNVLQVSLLKLSSTFRFGLRSLLALVLCLRIVAFGSSKLLLVETREDWSH